MLSISYYSLISRDLGTQRDESVDEGREFRSPAPTQGPARPHVPMTAVLEAGEMGQSVQLLGHQLS